MEKWTSAQQIFANVIVMFVSLDSFGCLYNVLLFWGVKTYPDHTGVRKCNVCSECFFFFLFGKISIKNLHNVMRFEMKFSLDFSHNFFFRRFTSHKSSERKNSHLFYRWILWIMRGAVMLSKLSYSVIISILFCTQKASFLSEKSQFFSYNH